MKFHSNKIRDKTGVTLRCKTEIDFNKQNWQCCQIHKVKEWNIFTGQFKTPVS